MNNGPSLVIRGTFIGSLVLASLGWFLAGQINLSPAAEVAYAAAPLQTLESSSPPENCQGSPSFPEGILQWCAIITAQANAVELPANLIAAVMLQERGGGGTRYCAPGCGGVR